MNSLVHGIFFTKKTKRKTGGKIKNKLVYIKKMVASERRWGDGETGEVGQKIKGEKNSVDVKYTKNF